MKEYKILSEKDKWFSGNFNPEALERALNAYAEQGWNLVSAFSVNIIAGFSGTREAALCILERDAD